MYIDTSAQNVGIGTTSPTGKLTVQGAAEGDTYFTGGTANSRLLNVFTSTAGSSANAGHNFKIASGEGEFIFGNNTTANVLKIKCNLKPKNQPVDVLPFLANPLNTLCLFSRKL